MIFVSTGAFPDKTADAATRLLLEHGIDAVELSGGLYSATLLPDLMALREAVHLQVHNYFPPPPQLFVFNLASFTPEIGEASMRHARQAISWGAKLGCRRYGFHAGYLIDPAVSELGKTIHRRQVNDRQAALRLFLERVDELARSAEHEDVELLIENNVVSPANFAQFGAAPLLMCTPGECVEIMHSTPENVRLLIDVAHLKVSARTLSFDPVAMLENCAQWTGGYHLSENNGLADTNDVITRGSWFWPHIRTDLDYYTLEVYDPNPAVLVSQRELAETIIV